MIARMTAKRSLLCAALIVCAAVMPTHAQLANASFETPGTAGTLFDGWGQFGVVAASGELATDGTRAARLTAPGSGGYGLSGVYQDIPIAPGQHVRVTVKSGFTGASPLVGQTRGIVNVEWRDAAGGLISYVSEVSSMSCDDPGTMHRLERIVGPAPPGAATARLLLGAFDTPAQQPGTVHYDEAEMVPIPPPTQGDIQWNDYGERVVHWSGYDWRLVRGGVQAPGDNLWSDNDDAAWVDALGRLHLRIDQRGGQWYSAGLAMTGPLGFGEYVFGVVGRVDQLDINTVAGLFLWEYLLDYAGAEQENVANEFDIEFSRWQDPASDPAQFVVQPWQHGNISRYGFTPADDEAVTTHAFDWNPDRVAARAWHGPAAIPKAEDMIHEWSYAGPDAPEPGGARVLINLWLLSSSPADGQAQELVLESFTFYPGCGVDLTGDGIIDIDDLYEIHANPVDINGDGEADARDRACLEAYLRRHELLEGGRR